MHEASRGLAATAELLVTPGNSTTLRSSTGGSGFTGPLRFFVHFFHKNHNTYFQRLELT